MSDFQTPIGPIFEFQREAIKRSVDLLQIPRSIRKELYSGGVAAGEDVGAQLIELSRQSIHQSLTAAEAVPGQRGEAEKLRETVDGVFDDLQTRHGEVYELIDESYERAETETLTRGAEQVQILLDLNRRIERQLVTAVEEIEQKADRSDEVVAEIETQIETLSEQLNRQTERYSELQSELEQATTIPVSEPGAEDDDSSPASRS